jgi:2'-5' RNA ligase
MEERRSFNPHRGPGRPHRPAPRPFPRRAPFPEGFSLFYVAIKCPPEIEDKIQEFKQYMNDHYGCRAAAKSPAHITVVPPFRAEDDMAAHLVNYVHTFNAGLVPVEVKLSGYGHFGDRVLYVDIKPSDALNALEKEAMAEFSSQFPSIIFGMKPDFNPHVTLATRDIPEGKLFEAKAYFETQHPYEAAFQARDLTLFQLEKGWWKAIS